MFYIHHKTTKKGILVPELSVCTKVFIRFISHDSSYADLIVINDDPQHTFFKIYVSQLTGVKISGKDKKISVNFTMQASCISILCFCFCFLFVCFCFCFLFS